MKEEMEEEMRERGNEEKYEENMCHAIDEVGASRMVKEVQSRSIV